MLPRVNFLALSVATALLAVERVDAGAVTFNKHVAPILFARCAPCHRPQQSAPFSLLTYDDAKKHATDIVKVTSSGYMPPWLPEHGYGEFQRERRLTREQVQTLQEWAASGTPEGAAADLPPPPNFPGGWQLGPPDLIVEMPQRYVLGGEGKDLYRNFVIPAPLKETRFVRGFEFHPRNRSVHHVRIKFDPTRQSRRLDEQDPEPGFGGMNTPARFPAGHMTTWIPGQDPAPVAEGLFWPLEKEADIVLQIHLQRTGKEEIIQPEIGFYFTNQAPARTSTLIGLASELIDIAPGERDYIVERKFELPADVEVISVLPHMHYLGREAEGFASLPDGRRQWLLRIKDWDFNWQGEYQYRHPVFLPAGSIVTMRYRFDNSEVNPRNPNHPPRQVIYGPQSADEMAELWLQVLPRDPRDLPALQKAQRMTNDLETVAFYENQLRLNPRDAGVHTALGKVLGPLGRLEEAIRHFQTAIQLRPDEVEPHYYLGLSLLTIREWDDARQEFETVLRLNPKYEKAHDGLGLLHLKLNNRDQAVFHFRRALELNPDDSTARGNLRQLGKFPPAE